MGGEVDAVVVEFEGDAGDGEVVVEDEGEVDAGADVGTEGAAGEGVVLEEEGGGEVLKTAEAAGAFEVDGVVLGDGEDELGAEGVGESVGDVDLGDQFVGDLDRAGTEVEAEGGEGFGVIDRF